MAISVETSAWPGILLGYETVVLTLLKTAFGRERLRKTCRDDLTAVRRHFLIQFILGLAVPLAAVMVLAASPAEVVAGLGLGFGKATLGLILVAAAVPVAYLAGIIGAADPEMRAFYPFSKKALSDRKAFFGYEVGYFLFYYTSWEFIFRGVFFFPVAVSLGLVPALAVSTAASTLFHIGHPDTEIYAALGAGFIFGLIAWWTGTFLYLIPIHAFIGIATDTRIFRLVSRERSRI